MRCKHSRVALLSIVAGVLLLAGCASLPPLTGRVDTHAATDTGNTRLGQSVAAIIAANPGKTGVHALPIPLDAFAARVHSRTRTVPWTLVSM